MSTIENKDVDVESYPLKDIVLSPDGNNNNNDDEQHVQISADSKSVRYRDEAELAHFGKRQQLKVSLSSTSLYLQTNRKIKKERKKKSWFFFVVVVAVVVNPVVW